MRKVSKTRVDDDVISSTNGSVNNDDVDKKKNNVDAEQAEANSDAEPDSQQPDNENEEQEEDGGMSAGDDDGDSDFEKSPKKKATTSKSKKKSAAKKTKKKQEEFEVEKIIDSKKIKGKLHFLIRWKGYSASSDTWEPENTVSCPDLIEKFNEQNKKEESESKKSPSKRKANSKTPKSTKKTKTSWDTENEDENAEYEVERILEVHHKKNGTREFLIHWKGWSNKFDSWEPEKHLNCPDLIKKFMEKVEAAKSTEARTLRTAPGATDRFTLQSHATGRRLSKRRGQRQRVRYDDAE